jgi:hypothetical protein
MQRDTRLRTCVLATLAHMSTSGANYGTSHKSGDFEEEICEVIQSLIVLSDAKKLDFDRVIEKARSDLYSKDLGMTCF